MNNYSLLPLLIDFNFTCKQDDPENHVLFDEMLPVPEYGSNSIVMFAKISSHQN